MKVKVLAKKSSQTYYKAGASMYIFCLASGLGEIREMKADPSLVAGYETNETNYMSQAERFP
jgi:hypothetical protein